MGGAHWRADNVEGVRQGEEVALRILREEMALYPEPVGGFMLTKFDGETDHAVTAPLAKLLRTRARDAHVP